MILGPRISMPNAITHVGMLVRVLRVCQFSVKFKEWAQHEKYFPNLLEYKGIASRPSLS